MCNKNMTKIVITLVVEAFLIVALYYILTNLHRESPEWWGWLINVCVAMGLSGKASKHIGKDDDEYE
jgi:hypothetical protein